MTFTTLCPQRNWVGRQLAVKSFPPVLGHIMQRLSDMESATLEVHLQEGATLEFSLQAP